MYLPLSNLVLLFSIQVSFKLDINSSSDVSCKLVFTSTILRCTIEFGRLTRKGIELSSSPRIECKWSEDYCVPSL